MVTKKTYKVVDQDGFGIRIFGCKDSADNFINNRPEFLIEVIKTEVESDYETGLRVCGECIL